MSMPFTDEQLALLRRDTFDTIATLKDEQVLAVFALSRFDGQIVRMTDTAFGKTKTGVFRIHHINGEAPDFSDSTKWQEVHIDSIEFSLSHLTPFGDGKDTYRNLTRIGEISLLRASSDA